MNAGPSPDLAEDPRFEEVFAAALKQHGLPAYLAEPVRRLVLGAADPRSFVCCSSGCTPCVKDYMSAAEVVLASLAKPARQRKRRWLFF